MKEEEDDRQTQFYSGGERRTEVLMENDRVCTFKSERSEHIHTSSSETQHSVALLCLD